MTAIHENQRGGSLAELLVSLAISSLLLLGVYASAQNLRQSALAAENLQRLEEQARFAVDLLRADIRRAGFWGLHADPEAIRIDPGAGVRCGSSEAGAWALRLQDYATAANDAWNLPCAPFENRRQPGTDVLEIRRADAETSAADARSLQVLSSRRQAIVFTAGTPPPLEGQTELRDLIVHAWYVSARSRDAPEKPSLRRKTLVRGKLLRDEEILSGVEDLQVRLALDTDRDGLADRVVDGGAPPNARVVAVRFWLLLRSDTLEPGYRDARIYTYADRAALSYSDSRRRLLVKGSEVVANAR